MSTGGPVVVLGAGGHAKVVIELLRTAGFATPAVLDADPTPRDVAGAPVVGDDTALARLRAEGLSQAFVAIGDNALRRKLADRATAAGFTLVSAIHPSAVISPSARLGAGVAVMAGAVVNADTVVGDLAILNTRSSVDHDGVIGSAAHIGPGCALAGGVTVGEEA
ncbi:MAG: sugar O-acyltransferase, sialic acid O-acetyltransferase NeuD family, partial [Caulobacter sp.]|nr:sugar O-acyltransferase, sialic acid O-acetyltransferase NeuD family [Caulobacter sp.]